MLTNEVPGEDRVYVLDAYSGTVKRVISGLDAPTGVAVDWVRKRLRLRTPGERAGR